MARRVIIKDEVSPKLEVLDDQLMDAVEKIFEYFAPIAETEMKAGARWTDRTGNARAGLISAAEREGNEFTLYFASMASYGIWLEIRWSGRYAIVGPVMKSIGPRLAKMITEVAMP